MADARVEEMQKIISSITTTQDLVDAYAKVENDFAIIEDEEYDYDEGTEECAEAQAVTDAWCDMMDELEERIMKIASSEGLLDERKDLGPTLQLEAFMDKYGYYNTGGWWEKKEDVEA